MEGDWNNKLRLRAGEPKRDEGGSDGGSIWNDPEPDGNVPGADPDADNIVSYGEYRGFFGDVDSARACCCTSDDWLGQYLR